MKQESVIKQLLKLVKRFFKGTPESEVRFVDVEANVYLRRALVNQIQISNNKDVKIKTLEAKIKTGAI